ncbi:hypothetical protein GCM10010211_07060 [Streptomyces albospinus]|uniref:Uncharacterized protein n=1 Tax=Streptomyces albospinus TaxID=285515 RepID=A0ABQ2UNC0_9ACTN|nr:hypothetical protein GCM10010211_07060 [Streptomyces albospinus]
MFGGLASCRATGRPAARGAGVPSVPGGAADRVLTWLVRPHRAAGQAAKQAKRQADHQAGNPARNPVKRGIP